MQFIISKRPIIQKFPNATRNPSNPLV
uniref:Uncharacterized protein n=1 Tax=Rhizophora mucronata TaxID=61149 RepID=A0A2P2QIE1_RHIMU